MNISRSLKLSAEFHNMAQQSLVDAYEHAARHVHMHIIYHRPDSPCLVQEFTWGTDDMLAPAVKLAEMIQDTSAAFERAKGAWGIEQALQEMEDVVDAVKKDIDAAKDLPREFSMSFKEKPHWEHAVMIEDVPFVKAQSLLRHWQKNLSNPFDLKGALNLVTITQEPKADYSPWHMRAQQKRIIN